MNIDGVVLLDRNGQSPFGNEYRVFIPEYFGIVPFDNAVVQGIGYFYIVIGRGKTFVSIKKQTITFHDTVVVIYSGIFNEIPCVILSVIKPSFAINFTGFTHNSTWSVHIGMAVFGEIIQPIGI